MSWWLKNNLRMIQNNIRDIDAKIDIDKHIEWLKSFDANVLQIGCGGITAFHPSELEFQYPSPYMTGDFFGEMLKKCHENGIRVIARFDFSKTHDSFYEKNPGWYFRSAKGEPIRYHDTVATCVNGAYQRERSLDIIREVLEKYPVDGIFFNMFGYITRDYSGNYVGICQCENCKRKFFEMYGENLPTEENLEDPVFLKYIEFKKKTVDEMLDKIHDLTKSISEEIAVSTYATHGIDIVRNESNSALDRPLPFWIYASSDNVGQIEGSYEDKISSNCVINAVDLPYRFMGVSKYLNQMRLYGDMASGGSLDWCIIGNFDDYPDYENFETTKKIFQFHKLYEDYYGHFNPKTKVMLVRDGGRHDMWAACAEYRGIFKMLKEAHIQFTIVELEALDSKVQEFDDYSFIILPEVHMLSATVEEALLRTTAAVIATGQALKEQDALLQNLFGVKVGPEISDVRGTYIQTEPKTLFPEFLKKQWVFLDEKYQELELLKGTKGILPKVEKSMFGPPERCFGHQQTASSMASVRDGKNMYLPWHIGSIFYKYGYTEYKTLFLDLMKSIRELPLEFETNLPEMVELFLSKCDTDTYMLQMINMTGFNGMSFFKPLDQMNQYLRFTNFEPISVEKMTAEGLKPVVYQDGFDCSMGEGEVYQSFLVRV